MSSNLNNRTAAQVGSQTVKLRLLTGGAKSHSLPEYVARFLATKASLSPNTLRSYRLTLDQYLEFIGPDHWPPSSENLNDYLISLKERGLKTSSILTYYINLKTFFNWLIKHNVLSQNPIDWVERPRLKKRVPRAPHTTVLKKFFAAIASYDNWHAIRDQAIFYTLLDTGLRIGEVAALQVGDIDFETLEIFVSKGKTGQRVVVFSTLASDYLTHWLEIRQQLGIPKQIRALFVSKLGRWRQLTTDGIRMRKEVWLQEAGIEQPLRVHDLRHAFAIYKLRNKGSLEDVRVQLGHADISTTAIYTLSDAVERQARHDKTTPLLDI